jgi:hypothetical protein
MAGVGDGRGERSAVALGVAVPQAATTNDEAAMATAAIIHRLDVGDPDTQTVSARPADFGNRGVTTR